ncbi:hypothetical protein D9M71_21650 [compost metagenome]
MQFSERYGYKPIREIIQKESMDDNLRNGIWSLFTIYLWNQVDYSSYQSHGNINTSNLKTLIIAYWLNFFKQPIDTIPIQFEKVLYKVRSSFFNCEWHEVYSFIEETLENYPREFKKNKEFFTKELNNCLEKENSAYRIINNEITPITSEQEIQSIEDALKNTNQYSGVQQHLNQALKLMSDRQNPDYRNSIKESISAVESICKIVTNEDKATLGKALKIIEDKHGLHAALKGSLSQLYGYTSDADGIRHAMLEESNLSYIDAKFMLVACTNFINYLIEKTK